MGKTKNDRVVEGPSEFQTNNLVVEMVEIYRTLFSINPVQSQVQEPVPHGSSSGICEALGAGFCTDGSGLSQVCTS